MEKRKRIIAVNSNCYHGYSLEEALDGISRAGFHYVELTATKGWTEHVFPDQTFAYLNSVKDKLKATGLKAFAMSGHCNLMDEERLPDFVMNMKLAAFFGCDYIVSSIGEAHLEDKAVTSNEEVAAHVRNLTPFLAENNLTLVLENHGDHGTGAILQEIVRLVDSPRVRINYDTGNAIFYGEADPTEDLAGCLDNVGYIHLKDKAGERQEWNFPALGRGYVDFPAIFELLEKNENDSPFSIEIEFQPQGPRDLAEINEAVQASRAYLQEQGFVL